MRSEFLPYYRPLVETDDIEAVARTMSTGWLTTGSRVLELEEVFRARCGARHALALNSATAALHLALIALGVEPGDDVVMPSLTFVAGANCVRQLGARPVFADVDADTMCVTKSSLAAAVTPNTKVIITMNYGGQPVGIRDIVAYAKSRNIAVLEDAAHAAGTLDDGQWPGANSDAAAFSFYATKNITSAEGGMLVTNRDDVITRARSLSLHGMDRDAWRRYEQGGTWGYDVTETGYKYNMPDVSAAFGLTQLRKMERLQEQRVALASRYVAKLRSVPGIKIVTLPATGPNRNSWCLFVISNDERTTGISRDRLIEELRKANIGTSVHFIPTHLFSAYKGYVHESLPTTDLAWKRLLSLPLYPAMTGHDVDDVVEALSRSLKGAEAPSSRAQMSRSGTASP